MVDPRASEHRRPRVAIINVYEDDNRGGAALTLAAVRVAKDLTSEHAEIFVVPVRAATMGALRHLRSEHDVTVLEPLIVPRPGRLGTMAAIVASILLVCGFPVRTRAARPETGRVLREADLVISRGGVVFGQRSTGLGDHIRLWLAALPAILARRYRRPLVFVGAQVGPVRTRAGGLVLRLAMGGATVIWARGPRSAEVARAVAGRRSRVVQGPDSVFLLPPAARNGDRSGVAIVVGGDQDLAGRAVPSIGAWVSAQGATCVVLQQVGGEDLSDRLWIERLRAAVGDRVRLRHHGDDLGVAEYMRELAHFELVVSTRMHSVLLSLLGGTPAVAVLIDDAYRKLDVLEGIGMAALATEAGDLAETIEHARRMKPAQVEAHAGRLRHDANAIVADIRDVIEARRYQPSIARSRIAPWLHRPPRSG